MVYLFHAAVEVSICICNLCKSPFTELWKKSNYNEDLLHLLNTRGPTLEFLTFLNLFSSFVYFCPNFQIFCPLCPFLPFFWNKVPYKNNANSLIKHIGIWHKKKQDFISSSHLNKILLNIKYYLLQE